jgi:cation diffusion facilitator family transporter
MSRESTLVEQDSERSRAYYGYQEAVVSIVVNLALSAIKFAAGLYINSIALLIDGVHSLSDIASSVVILLGFRTAEKPPDKEHPFGHGRVEDVTSLTVSILLIIVGVEFLITSMERVYHPHVVKGNIFFFLLVILTIVMKEGLARYSAHLSRKIDSDALVADAWHHRSDALSSIPVALGVLASHYGIFFVDSLSGIFVSAIVVYVGYKLAKNAISSLLGEAPPEEFVQEIKNLATVDGVTTVHDIIVHDYKTRKVISLRVKVEPMGLEEAHTLADSIEKRIAHEKNASVVVHIDGVTLDDSIKEEISKIVEGHKEIVSCHAIDIGEKIDFHILVDKNMTLERAHELTHHIEDDVAQVFEKEVIIHVEPCIQNCTLCSQQCREKT